MASARQPLEITGEQTRRSLLRRVAGLGTVALTHLLHRDLGTDAAPPGRPGVLAVAQVPIRAKRVIYLFMSGGPSQLDLFDYKPNLVRFQGHELPDSVRGVQRLPLMMSNQKNLPCRASPYRFSRHGDNGLWISELIPYTATLANEILIVRSLHTEAINHDPGVTAFLTGHQQPGRPSLGAWLSYGLGTENENLPAFVVLTSRGSGCQVDQPLSTRFWGSGFLPPAHQGTPLRSGEEPVLYLSNPPGVTAQARRDTLDTLAVLNQRAARTVGDPEIVSRISQYELAFRMQSAVPELTDLSRETLPTLERYGLDRERNDGGFARNCLLARRLVERGVRFVQLMHRGWDQHSNLSTDLPRQCHDVDQPAAALIHDLKARGLLEDTLVVWAGEFGRTVYGQDPTSPAWGRNHHGRCFSVWLAGAGLKRGQVYGATDEFGYNVTSNPVSIHDLNATILHCLGIDHKRLTYRFQGRDFRLTDVQGEVIKDLFA